MLDKNQSHLHLEREKWQGKITYSGEKRWKIFSWASSLLTGGLVGAAISNSSEQSLSLNSKIFLTVAIFAISGYAIEWLKYQGRELQYSLQALQAIEQEIGLRDFPSKNYKQPWISYELVLLVLAVMAAILIWI